MPRAIDQHQIGAKPSDRRRISPERRRRSKSVEDIRGRNRTVGEEAGNRKSRNAMTSSTIMSSGGHDKRRSPIQPSKWQNDHTIEKSSYSHNSRRSNDNNSRQRSTKESRAKDDQQKMIDRRQSPTVSNKFFGEKRARESSTSPVIPKKSIRREEKETPSVSAKKLESNPKGTMALLKAFSNSGFDQQQLSGNRSNSVWKSTVTQQLEKPIVNELSVESLKRSPRKSGGYSTRGFTSSAGRGSGTFGRGNEGYFGFRQRGTDPAQSRGFGTRGAFVGGNRSAHGMSSSNNGGYRASSKRCEDDDNFEGKRSKYSDPEKPMMLLVDPASVPRGRNYFMHDSRDQPRDAEDRWRGGSRGGRERSYTSYNQRRDGHHERDRHGGERYSVGERQSAPMGWRNHNEDKPMGDSRRTMGRDVQRFDRYPQNQNERKGYSNSFAYNPQHSSRSRADEASVWMHDKFLEMAQEENTMDFKIEVETRDSGSEYSIERPADGSRGGDTDMDGAGDDDPDQQRKAHAGISGISLGNDEFFSEDDEEHQKAEA